MPLNLHYEGRRRFTTFYSLDLAYVVVTKTNVQTNIDIFKYFVIVLLINILFFQFA